MGGQQQVLLKVKILCWKEASLRTDLLFTIGLGQMIDMVLMKSPKPRGFSSIEMLPVQKWNYCAIVQKPVRTNPEAAHTIPPSIPEEWVQRELSTERY